MGNKGDKSVCHNRSCEEYRVGWVNHCDKFPAGTNLEKRCNKWGDEKWKE
jgi:hypothetical protein